MSVESRCCVTASPLCCIPAVYYQQKCHKMRLSIRWNGFLEENLYLIVIRTNINLACYFGELNYSNASPSYFYSYSLPLQYVVAWCLPHCTLERSTDSGCKRTVEMRRLDEAGLTGLWCPGTYRHGQRPQQPCCQRQGRQKHMNIKPNSAISVCVTEQHCSVTHRW